MRYKVRFEVSLLTARRVLSFHTKTFLHRFESVGGGGFAVFVYIISIAYVFLMLAVVIDEYFVLSIGVILRKLAVRQDLAGAIFMAAGTSSAELFSNVIDTFVYRTNIGFGVIYGTVLFNIFIGIGYASFTCPSEHKKLAWDVMLRDTTWYLISIAFVVGFIWDHRVYWYESFVLVLLYVSYVLCVVFHETIFRAFLGPNALPKRVNFEMKKQGETISHMEIVPILQFYCLCLTVLRAAECTGAARLEDIEISEQRMNASDSDTKQATGSPSTDKLPDSKSSGDLG